MLAPVAWMVCWFIFGANYARLRLMSRISALTLWFMVGDGGIICWRWNRSVDAAKVEREAQERKDAQARVRAEKEREDREESERQLAEDKARRERQRLDDDRAARIAVYRAMKPWERTAEIVKLCPSKSDSSCPRPSLDEVVQGAGDATETKALEAAVNRAANSHAAAVHEASRLLLCCDGSYSGCQCNGAHRGCCSHHGGVCGCAP
ncbi:MAG: hypothetical protein ACHREM_20395 [Polyangiales bacterium]